MRLFSMNNFHEEFREYTYIIQKKTLRDIISQYYSTNEIKLGTLWSCCLSSNTKIKNWLLAVHRACRMSKLDMSQNKYLSTFKLKLSRMSDKLITDIKNGEFKREKLKKCVFIKRNAKVLPHDVQQLVSEISCFISETIEEDCINMISPALINENSILKRKRFSRQLKDSLIKYCKDFNSLNNQQDTIAELSDPNQELLEIQSYFAKFDATLPNCDQPKKLLDMELLLMDKSSAYNFTKKSLDSTCAEINSGNCKACDFEDVEFNDFDVVEEWNGDGNVDHIETPIHDMFSNLLRSFANVIEETGDKIISDIKQCDRKDEMKLPNFSNDFNQKMCEARCEILVCTPERLIDLVKKRATNLRRVTYLVFDEADKMFNLGSESQVRSIAKNVDPKSTSPPQFPIVGDHHELPCKRRHKTQTNRPATADNKSSRSNMKVARSEEESDDCELLEKEGRATELARKLFKFLNTRLYDFVVPPHLMREKEGGVRIILVYYIDFRPHLNFALTFWGRLVGGGLLPHTLKIIVIPSSKLFKWISTATIGSRAWLPLGTRLVAVLFITFKHNIRFVSPLSLSHVWSRFLINCSCIISFCERCLIFQFSYYDICEPELYCSLSRAFDRLLVRITSFIYYAYIKKRLYEVISNKLNVVEKLKLMQHQFIREYREDTDVTPRHGPRGGKTLKLNMQSDFKKLPQNVQFFVRLMDGKILNIKEHIGATISQLKIKIEEKSNIPMSSLVLSYNGQKLRDGKTILDYDISRNATVTVIAGLSGGGVAEEIATAVIERKKTLQLLARRRSKLLSAFNKIDIDVELELYEEAFSEAEEQWEKMIEICIEAKEHDEATKFRKAL